MDWLDLALSTARGASFAAVLSAFGVAAFRVLILPDVLAREEAARGHRIEASLSRLCTASLAAAILLALVWLALQSASMAGATGWREMPSDIGIVTLRTQFGHLMLTRLALLAVSIPFVTRAGRWRDRIAVVPVGAALLTQLGFGHAAAMGGPQGAELLGSEAMHLLAAGAWLGALLPLGIVLRRVSPGTASAASHDFTPLGLACVALLAGTGLLQARELIGGLAGLVGTAYGLTALVKIGLFGALLALACANRFVFTERLEAGDPGRAQRRLIASIAVETALGLAVVIAAGRLASLAPSIHEQATWPFAVRPALDALSDPLVSREVGLALAGVAGCVVLAASGLFWRRVRWPCFLAVLALAWLCVPHLGPLFVEAFPSTFYVSPTEFGDSDIMHGQQLYVANCSVCHGLSGRGDGPAAKGLADPPADLTAEHLWMHPDGDLFWYISYGFPNPEGGLWMPGFAAKLSSDSRWSVLDYVHALNVGDSMGRTGTWAHAPSVPQFDAVCAGGQQIDMDDLRSRNLLFIAGDLPARLPAIPGLAVIQLARSPGALPPEGVCVAAETDTWPAFAILVGVAPDRLDGAEILADRTGLLRERSLPGLAGGWIGDDAALAAAVADVDAHPVPAPAGHHHH